MSRQFRFRYTDEFDLTVERDEDGAYVERSRGARLGWTVLGLFIAGVSVWFVVAYDGPEGWILSTATPAAIAAFALLGIAAEWLFGTDRSAVIEEGDRYYLEMLPSSRLYVLAGAVTALMAGASVVVTTHLDPGPSVGRGRGLVSLARSLPFGEFLLLGVGAAIALWLGHKAVTGRMPIQPKGV